MRILFQGDSITDADRLKTEDGLGYGYPRYAAELIRGNHPEIEFEFINRAVGGNRICDLADRWQRDCIGLKPDVVSVLIGVNDCLKYYLNPKSHLPDEDFERMYRGILTATREQTGAGIIILEQFTVDHNTYNRDFYDDLFRKIRITRHLARELADAFIPLDGIFAETVVGPGVWPDMFSGDSIHLFESGHRIIARHYADAFEKVLSRVTGKGLNTSGE